MINAELTSQLTEAQLINLQQANALAGRLLNTMKTELGLNKTANQTLAAIELTMTLMAIRYFDALKGSCETPMTAWEQYATFSDNLTECIGQMILGNAETEATLAPAQEAVAV
jgi:hypothetical protein